MKCKYIADLVNQWQVKCLLMLFKQMQMSLLGLKTVSLGV